MSSDEFSFSRAAKVREQFLAVFCTHWPAIYRAQLPFTESVKELLKQKQCIESEMLEDFNSMKSPWLIVGEGIKRLDISELSAEEKIALGISREREVGMPGLVKPGRENDPEVIEAKNNRTRTAEWVAAHEAQMAFKQAQTSPDAWKAYEDAQKRFDALRKNPSAGMVFVRDVLTDKQLQAEHDAE